MRHARVRTRRAANRPHRLKRPRLSHRNRTRRHLRRRPPPRKARPPGPPGPTTPPPTREADRMRLIPSFMQRSEAERTGTMSVMEHLEELRRRIVIAFFAVLGGAVVGWFLYPYVLELLQDPYCQYLRDNPAVRPPAGCRLVINSPVDAFLTKIKMVGFLGLFVALPVVLYQLWAFIVP